MITKTHYLVFLLAAACSASPPVRVDGDWQPGVLSLRLQVPRPVLADFDDNRDGQLSLQEIQQHRVFLRERLKLQVRVRTGSTTLTPSMSPAPEGVRLLYTLPPGTDSLVLGSNEECHGTLRGEEFQLANGERRFYLNPQARWRATAYQLLPLLGLLWLGWLLLKRRGAA